MTKFAGILNVKIHVAWELSVVFMLSAQLKIMLQLVLALLILWEIRSSNVYQFVSSIYLFIKTNIVR